MAEPPRALAGVAILLLAGACAGCNGSDLPETGDAGLLQRNVPAVVTISTRVLPGVGRVLTDSTGRALYVFPPDAASRVSCTGPCAGTWPTLALRDGTRPHAAAPALAGLLGTLPDPNTGARVVTYDGNPLYRYAGDIIAGTANGQGLFVDGGPWYLLNARGEPVTSSLTPSLGPGHQTAAGAATPRTASTAEAGAGE